MFRAGFSSATMLARLTQQASHGSVRAHRQYATKTATKTPGEPGRKALARKTPAAPAPQPKAMKSPPARVTINAFTLFMSTFAEERKKAGERFLLKDAGVAFRALPDSEKAKLLEQLPEIGKQRKAVYDEFVSKLTPSAIVEENKIRAALRKARTAAGKAVPESLAPILDPNAPTKPGSAYIQFSLKHREDADITGKPFVEQAKLLGQKWNELGEEEKAEWNDRAKKAMASYNEKKKEYYASS